MRKRTIKTRFICAGFILTLGTSSFSYGQNAPKRVVEAVPTFNTMHHVSAAQTPSGFPVPRYVSLKVGKVNGRTGPSRQHPIAWKYQRKGLPLIVVAETEMWRKVRDVQGDESWMHKPALSGERRVLILEQTMLRSKPRVNARVKASLERNAIMTLLECNDLQWCFIQSDDGLKGWTPKQKLWGAHRLY